MHKELDDDLNQLINFINKQNYLIAEEMSLELVKKKKYNNPLFFNLCGIINQNLQKFDLANESYKKALELDNKFCPALYNLGLLKFQVNHYRDAFFYFSKALEADPNNYDYNLMLAESLVKLKKFDKAIFNYEKTIKIYPKKKEAYLNLSNLYLSLNLLFEAQTTLKSAIEIIGEDLKLQNNFGLILKRKKKLDEAIFLYKKILITEIHNFEPYANLSLCYYEKGDYLKSLEFINIALAKKPNDSEFLYFKSRTLEKMGRLEESLENIEKVILKNKNDFKATQKKIEIFIKLLMQNESKVLIESLDFNNQSIKLNAIDSLVSLIFLSNYLYGLDYLFYLKLIDLHNNILQNENEFAIKKLKNENCYDKNNFVKKIKIGFVSADFNNHAVSFQLKNFFISLSKNSSFEIFFYYNSEKKDEINSELRQNIKNWTEIYGLSDYEVAKKISDNKLNILIDLSGFTSGNRLGVFSYKICKNQITWAGYLNSVGVSGIDYILADPFVIPRENSFECFYKEKILRFDNCWSTLALFDDAPHDNFDKIPFHEKKILTFGSQNNYLKYNERVLDLWSDVIRCTQNTRLLLAGNEILINKNFQQKIYSIFKKKNINQNRIIFKGRFERKESLKIYNDIDISLDPFPYNGGTTNFESAYMCVPTITLVGNNFISRCGYSINMNLNNNEWNCFSEQEYIDKAINFSLNPTIILDAKKKIYENIFIKKKFSSKNLVENFIQIVNKII